MGEGPDRIDPSGIPTYTGYLGQLELDHAALTGDATSFRDIGDDVHTRFQGLASFYTAPEAEQLFATTETVKSRADSFADELEVVGAALSEYYDTIRPLVEKLNELKADAEAFVVRISDDDEWTYDEDKVAENNKYVEDVSTTVGQFWEAERTAANKILALFSCKQWTADDGSGGDSMYGFAPEDMAEAEETPWGKTVTEDHYWYEIGYHVKSFVWDGIVMEGIVGTVEGLVTLLNPWDENFGKAWDGVGKLAVGIAVLSTPGSWLTIATMPEGPVKDYVNDSLTVTEEFGKSLIAWDEWSENPAKAAGIVTFNVVTAVASFGTGTAVEGAGLTARAVATVARIGEIIDPMTYVAKGVTSGLNGLSNIGELTVKLTDFDAFKGVELPDGGFVLPDGTTLVPEFPDGTVKLPDGSLLHPDGTLDLPEGTRQPGDEAPVEMSGDDLGLLDDTADAMDDTDFAGAPDSVPDQVPDQIPDQIPDHVPDEALVPVAAGADPALPGAVDDLGDLAPTAAYPGAGTPDLPGRTNPPGVVDTSPYGPTPQAWPPPPGTRFDNPVGGSADDWPGGNGLPGNGSPGHWPGDDLPQVTDDLPGTTDDWAGTTDELADGHGTPDDARPPADLDGDGVPDEPGRYGDGEFGDDVPSGGGDGPPPPPPTRPPPPGPPLPDPPPIRDLVGRDLSSEQLIPELQRGVDGTFGSGEFTVKITEATSTGNTLTWRAEIFDRNGNEIGKMTRNFLLDHDVLFVKHEFLHIQKPFRGQGFGTEFSRQLEDWYRSSGVQRIELEAGSTKGGYTWAKAGYNFANASEADKVFNQLRRALKWMDPPPNAAESEAIRELLARERASEFGDADYPWPSDIAGIDFGTDFARRFLTRPGFSWRGVKFL